MPGKYNFILVAQDGKAFDVEFGKLAGLVEREGVAGEVEMPKLSEYVEMAANEYLLETEEDELDARWIAELFQDSGVQDDYQRLNLIAFSGLVQKALILKSGQAGKQTHFQLYKVVHFVRRLRKP